MPVIVLQMESKDWMLFIEAAWHIIFDVWSYWMLGNEPDDGLTLGERIFGTQNRDVFRRVDYVCKD